MGTECTQEKANWRKKSATKMGINWSLPVCMCACQRANVPLEILAGVAFHQKRIWQPKAARSLNMLEPYSIHLWLFFLFTHPLLVLLAFATSVLFWMILFYASHAHKHTPITYSRYIHRIAYTVHLHTSQAPQPLLGTLLNFSLSWNYQPL